MTTAIQEIDLLNTDIQAAMEQAEEYQELISNIEKAKEESSEVVVYTANDVNTASHFIKNFKKIAKDVEDLRKRMKQPLTDKGKEIDSFFKSIPQRFQDELDRLNQEILDFKKKQQEEARRKAEEERKKAEEEAINKAIDNDMDEPAIVLEVNPKEVKISQANTSGVHTRKTKKVEITDFVAFVKSLNDEQIQQFLEPNMKNLNAERSKYPAINEDFSEVKAPFKGVRFTYTESVV